tara:strand:+ start:1662 stop:1934 length:273 start_codon:yes stop_codon:yes gene_type:complete
MESYIYNTNRDLEIEFVYDYEPGEPMIHTYPNGDPGHPGVNPEIKIIKALVILKERNSENTIEIDLNELYEELDIDLDHIEDLILKEHEG